MGYDFILRRYLQKSPSPTAVSRQGWAGEEDEKIVPSSDGRQKECLKVHGKFDAQKKKPGAITGLRGERKT